MKIYTKKGDTGTTSLIGGTRVPKNHLRVECYGTIDELNSWFGVLRDQNTILKESELIQKIQNQLFNIGSCLAADPEKNKMHLPDLDSFLIEELESSIDTWEESLPALKNFILPGGCLAASYAHIARCVCRRAERLCVSLAEIAEIAEISPIILPFLNRLSDWLFVYSRILNHRSGGQEILWQPNK